MNKIAYDAPKLSILGSVSDLTAGSGDAAADGAGGGSVNEKISPPS